VYFDVTNTTEEVEGVGQSIFQKEIHGTPRGEREEGPLMNEERRGPGTGKIWGTYEACKTTRGGEGTNRRFEA